MIYSSFFRRAVAFIIDSFIIFCLSAMCMRVTLLLPFAFILHFFYRPIFESCETRATPGKYLAEISVCKVNGDRLSLKEAYIRYFLSYFSWLIFGLGYLLALFNKKHQTLHDIFVDTVVIDQVYQNNGLFNEWLNQIKFAFLEIKKLEIFNRLQKK